MKRGRFLRLILGALIAVLLLGLGSASAMAAKKRCTWYKNKNSKVFYYDKNGHKLKDGKYKIKGKYYYFDEDGVQRTGWQKIGKNYYYFKIGEKKKGYMMTSTTVNGIRLKSNGRAVKTSYSKKKLPLLYAANLKMRSLTKCSDTKSQRLEKCCSYMLSELRKTNGWVQLYNLDGGAYVTGGHSDWDIHYATPILVDQSTNRADCNTLGCVFAYLANACGYTARCAASGGHGWAEIRKNGKYYVYDLDWAIVKNNTAYCGLPLSGGTLLGAPNYKGAGYYKVTI